MLAICPDNDDKQSIISSPTQRLKLSIELNKQAFVIETLADT